ncbi:MAG: hypothetical protein LBK18_06180 [Prevotellaceae bacterium]|jgi:hypothetical protein|nr:hypothetical protein [Prevotellaceae bacterium]
MTEQQAYFIKRLDEIAEQYKLTKKVIIFLEKYNKGNNSYLGPHNEVRNAYDHVMKMVTSKNDTDEVERQYQGAKSHLMRAGHDAYELLCTNCIYYINNTIAYFKPSDIKNGFPDYYSKGIRAKIIEIQEGLAGYKARHSGDDKVQDLETHDADEAHNASDLEEAEKDFSRCHEFSNQLLEYSNEMDKHVSDMSDFREERIKKEDKEAIEKETRELEERNRHKQNKTIAIFAIIATIVGAVIGAVISAL